MNIDKKIQEKLNERKWYHRVTAITLVFSLLCAFFVPLDLVMPGAATTANPSISTDGSFSEAPDHAIGDPLEKHITGTYVRYNNTNYSNPINVPAGNDNPAQLDIFFAFEFSAEAGAAFLKDEDGSNPDYCLYYNVLDHANPSDLLQITQQYAGNGRSQQVFDSNGYSSTVPAGYFAVNPNGMLVLHLTEAYIAHMKKKSETEQGFQGEVHFKANVDRDDTKDGTQTFTLNGQTVNVIFTPDEASIEKQGKSTVGKNADGTKYIDWTVVVKNPNGHVDLNGYTLSDILTKGSETENIDLSQATIIAKNRAGEVLNGTYGTGDASGYKFNYTNDSNPANNPAEIIFTYRQEGVQNAVNYSNKATLTGGGKPVEDTDTRTIQNEFEITKTGQPDYYYQQIAEDKIRWTITVENKSGDSLSKAIVTDEKFPNTGVKVYKLVGEERVEMTSGFTLSGNTLTMEDDSTLPSKVIIEYDEMITFVDADNYWSKEVWNAETGRNDLIPNLESPKPVPVAERYNSATVKYPDGTEGAPAPKTGVSPKVEYAHGTYVEKTTGGATNQEKGVIQWKITVYANKTTQWDTDGNSKATVNGYTLQDAMFSDFDNTTLKMGDGEDGKVITYNAYFNNNAVATDKVQLAKNGDTLTINCTEPVNKLELFYTVPLTDEQKQALNDSTDGKITITNDATATNPENNYSKTGTGTYELNSRKTVSKRYTGTDTEISAIGQTNYNDIKVMPWEVEMIKDTGFGDGGLIVTDIMNAAEGDGDNTTSVANLHYIAPSQVSSIKLYGKYYDSQAYPNDPISSSLYELVFYDADGNVIENFAEQIGETVTNAVKFEVKFKKDAGLEDYRYIKMEYETTANIAGVEEGRTIKFVNGVDFDGAKPTENPGTLTFTRTEIDKPDTMKLTVQKTWEDNGNAYGLRPANIQVKVLRALANADGTKKADSDWKTIKEANSETDKIYTLTVSKTNNQDTLLIPDEFPQWVVNADGKTYTRYVYKVEEVESVLPAGYSRVDVTDDTGKVIEPVVYATGDKTVQLKNQLISNNVYGKIATYGPYQQNTPNPISLNDYSNFHKTINLNGQSIDCYLFWWKLSFDLERTDENKSEYVDFIDTMPKGAIYAGTLVDGKLDSKVYFYSEQYQHDLINSTYPNSYVREDNGKLLIHVPREIMQLEYAFYIPTNELAAALRNGELVNKIRLNEPGEVNHEGTLTITDVPETQQLTKKAVEASAGHLAYTIDVNPTAAQLSGDGFITVTDAMRLTSETSSNIKVELDQEKVKVYSYNGRVRSSEPLPAKEYQVTKLKPEAGEVSRFILTLPDEQHFTVEYEYEVSGYASDDVLKFSNTAAFTSDYGAGTSTADENQMSTQDAGGSITQTKYAKIYKIEVGNDTLNTLNAKFKVAKWDGSKWIYASDVHLVETEEKQNDGSTKTVKNSRGFTFDDKLVEGDSNRYPEKAADLVFSTKDDTTTEDKENLHNFTLEAGLYKFVEVEAPPTYQQPDWSAKKTFADNSDFIFYYKYGDYDGKVPTGISPTPVSALGTINIPNSKAISITASKTFSGTDLPENSTVVFQLYRSTARIGEGSTPVLVADSNKTITYPSEKTVTWSNLLSGNGETPYYYHVKEYSYTVGSETYRINDADGKYYLVKDDDSLDLSKPGSFKPVYSGNGINSTGKVEVNNSQGIVVRKLWTDLNDKEIAPPVDSNGTPVPIRFTIYGVRSDSTESLIDVSGATLDSTNNYMYTLPEELAEGFVSFYVEEVTDQLDALGGNYESQVRSSGSGTGVVFTITNKDKTPITTKAKVVKTWADGGNHTEDVKVKLIQSTTPITDETLATANPAGSIQGNARVVVVSPGETAEYTLRSGKTLKNTSVSPVEMITVAEQTGKLQITAAANADDDTTRKLTVNYTDGTSDEVTISILNQKAKLQSGHLEKTWNNLPYSDSNGQRYYYYVLETSEFEGYSASYEVNVTSDEQTTSITNDEDTNLTVTKNWGATPTDYQNPVKVQLWVSDDGYNSWTYTGKYRELESPGWSGKFSGLDNTKHYKVVETEVNDSTAALSAYQVGYSSENVTFDQNESSKTITVTNTLKTGGLEVEKKWHDEDTSNRKAVTVNVYRKSQVTVLGTYGKTTNAMIYNTNLPQDATIAGISKNLSRRLSLHNLQANEVETDETDTESIRFNLNLANTISILASGSDDSSASFAIQNNTDQNLEIQDSYVTKQLSNMVIYFDGTPPAPSDTNTVNFNLMTASWSGIRKGSSSVDGNTVVWSYDNATGGKWMWFKTTCTEKIEKVVYNYSDGSSFTVNNSNYGSSSSADPVTTTISHGITTSPSDNKQWKTIEIPSDFHSREVSSVVTYFKDSIDSFPNGDNDTNIYLNGNNGYENGWNVSQNTSIKSFRSGKTDATQIGYWTMRGEEIEKIVLNYTDGSMLTVNNTNFNAGGSDTPVTGDPVHKEDTRTFTNGQWETQRIDTELDGRELSGLKVVFTENLPSGLSFNNIESNYINPYFKDANQSDYSGTTPKNWNANSYSGNVVTWGINAGFTNARYLGWQINNKDVIKEIVVSYKDGSTYTLKNAEYQEPEPETYEPVMVDIPKDAQKIGTLILQADSWKDSLDGLPLYDPDGNAYVYFIEEVEVPGYMPIGYYLEGGTNKTANSTTLTQNGVKGFTVHNAEDESNASTLPTSGGQGTRIYYTLGGILLLLSAAGYVTAKRRRWSDG